MGPKINRLLEVTEENYDRPFTAAQVAMAFVDRIEALGYSEEIFVTDSYVDVAGFVKVQLANKGELINLVFGVESIDDEEGVFALIDTESMEPIIIDLDPIDPPILSGTMGEFADLTNLGWLSKSVFDSFIQATKLDSDTSDDTYASKFILKGGKQVKLPIMFRKSKKNLGSSMYTALKILDKEGA